MSVFGIDTLFLDTKAKIIYFGESKFSADICKGIKLVNRSLKDYEQQILEEYRVVLGPDDAYPLSVEFIEIFGEYKKICISLKKLIEIAKIDTIGVPIFIAHGNCEKASTPDEFIEQMLTKIQKKTFWGYTQNIFLYLYQ